MTCRKKLIEIALPLDVINAASADEAIQHLSTLPSAEVEVMLEIQLRVPGGVKDDVVRTVTENSNVLTFKTHGFE